MTDPRETLARTILDVTEAEHPADMYVLYVREARTLARAVIDLTAERDAYREENTRLREQAARVKALADELDREASEHMDRPVYSRSGTRIRTALNGDNA